MPSSIEGDEDLEVLDWMRQSCVFRGHVRVVANEWGGKGGLVAAGLEAGIGRIAACAALETVARSGAEIPLCALRAQ